MKKLFKHIKNFAKKCWKAVKEVCKKIVETIQKAAQWCLDNQETVLILSAAAEGGYWIYKKIRKSGSEREMDYQRKHVYDHSVGHHWTLRRELTSNEMLELERRKDNGESLGNILSSMRVLA